MNNYVAVILSYELVYRSDRLVYELWLHPYGINEWLVEPNDRITIELTDDKLWILDRLKDYLII